MMRKKLKAAIFILVAVFAIQLNVVAQKQYKAACIAFYNLENIFDTIDQADVDDAEFLPNGANQWTGDRYWSKIKNMSEVIAQIGDEMTPGGPMIIGVAEIENISPLEDLCKSAALAPSGYAPILIEGPDKRGVDVGLLYQKNKFKVVNAKSYRLINPLDTGWKTRDQLLVSGIHDGELMHIIVNHWPSRSGGEKRSAPLRNMAADLTRKICDSLLTADPNAKIVVMGDLNDDPDNKSLIEHLKAKGNKDKLKTGELFNPTYNLFKKDGIGSLAYNDSWNFFDQIIVSQAWLGDDKSTFKFHKVKVFNKKFITQKDGRYQGYPFRTYAGGVYQNGYSDHFPSYIFIIKEKK